MPIRHRSTEQCGQHPHTVTLAGYTQLMERNKLWSASSERSWVIGYNELTMYG